MAPQMIVELYDNGTIDGDKEQWGLMMEDPESGLMTLNH